MHLIVLIPCVLIAILGADLLGSILEQGRRQLQSRQRRDAVQRWIRDVPLNH
jgi:hypothetical protein